MLNTAKTAAPRPRTMPPLPAASGLRYVQVPVRDESDVLSSYRGTPVEDLLLAQNTGRRPRPLEPGKLVVGLGLDRPLALPDNFGLQVRATPETLADWLAVALSIRPVEWTAIVLDAQLPLAECVAWQQMDRLWSRFPATHMAPLLYDACNRRLLQVGRYYVRDPLTWSVSSASPPPSASEASGVWAG
jgi:hypothetical protein